MTIPALRNFGYDEIEVVGLGGLGDVYRARRISTGGPVAIKVIREQIDREATDRRVRRELDALLKLKGHPNVVQIEELVGLPTGLALVMEFVAGGSLMDLLSREGPLPPARVVSAMAEVTRAVRDAHLLGIVHRDIKPHNVMVGQFGQCKVCDFGIAAMFKESAYTDRTSALSYRYASPEELDDAADIGPATDVYSLGVTLRQLLTGETSATRAATQVAATEGRPLSAAQVGARRTLLSLVDRMTNGDPALRPSADAVLQVMRELERALGSERVSSVLAESTIDRPDIDATVVRPRTPAQLAKEPEPANSSEPQIDDRTVLRPRGAPSPSPLLPLPDPESVNERWWES